MDIPLLFRTPRLAAAKTNALSLARGGTQFLPVSGTLTDRLLVTYRAAAQSLAPLVPAPFQLDTRARYGFLSVCAVEIADMGIAFSPRFLRWQNREFLYRLQVRLGNVGTFITLRSDVTSRALALLGRHFSHYRPHLAQIELRRTGSRLFFGGTTPGGIADATVEVDWDAVPSQSSVFASDAEAAGHLLGMRFSADSVAGRVRLQEITHGPWRPRRVATVTARFAFVERLGQQLGVRFELDNTLAVQNVPHVWRAAQWLK